MLHTFEYTNETERADILSNNSSKILIEEQNLLSGNFLIFSDEPRIEEQVAQLKNDNLILMDALATVFEEILNIQAMQGGTP
jgi:hypothetical protein